MKTKFKSFLISTSLLLIGFMTGCSKDDDQNGTGGADNAELKISISSPSNFKATEDPNATIPEATLNTVDVFIYNESSQLVKHQQLTSSDFTYQPGVTDLYVTNTKIATTTGLKNIYVGVNLPSNLIDFILESGPSSVFTIANVLQIADPAVQFSMFSEAKITTTLVANSNDPANTIYAPVKRLVAKVAFQEGVGLSKNIAGGVISNLQYTIKNVNTKFYPLQLNDGGIIKDPNWTLQSAGVIATSDFYQSTNYIPVNSAAITENKNLTAQYATENTSEDKYADEMTYTSVRGSFVPNTVKVYLNGTDASGGFTDQNNIGSPVMTFYRLPVSDGLFVYGIDSDVLTDYANVNSLSPATIQTYMEGYCYYNVFLNPKNGFNVFRNDFYKTTITKINGIGNHLSEDVTHIPLEEPTDMDVTIEIIPWNVVDSDTELSR